MESGGLEGSHPSPNHGTIIPIQDFRVHISIVPVPLRVFKVLGFTEWYMNSGRTLPLAFAHCTSINLSFIGFSSYAVMKVLFGIFKESSVSWQLNACWGCIIWLRSLSHYLHKDTSLWTTTIADYPSFYRQWCLLLK